MDMTYSLTYNHLIDRWYHYQSYVCNKYIYCEYTIKYKNVGISE